MQNGSEITRNGIVLEDDSKYQLIVDCNALFVDIENEIVIIHNFIRDKYRLKFPELESLVHHPIDYARVVKKIGNEIDLTLVDLEGLYLRQSLWSFLSLHLLLVGSLYKKIPCKRLWMLVIEHLLLMQQKGRCQAS